MALIACKACGHEISDRAAACPSCGEPNMHPEVERFVASVANIATAVPFTVTTTQTEVFGETSARSPGWAWVVAIAIFLAGIPAQESWGILGGGLCGFFAVLLLIKTRTAQTFHADLASRTWSSSDEYFWKPVRDALQL